MDSRKDINPDQETDQPDSERLQFKINIMKDGTTVIEDVPSRLIPFLKKIYPDDPRLIDMQNEPENAEKPNP